MIQHYGLHGTCAGPDPAQGSSESRDRRSKESGSHGTPQCNPDTLRRGHPSWAPPGCPEPEYMYLGLGRGSSLVSSQESHLTIESPLVGAINPFSRVQPRRRGAWRPAKEPQGPTWAWGASLAVLFQTTRCHFHFKGTHWLEFSPVRCPHRVLGLKGTQATGENSTFS